MTTLLEIPLREVSTSAIQALKSKYPEAMLRVETEDKVLRGSMEAQFWAIIDLLDWRTMNADLITAPAIEALSHFSKDDIHAFHDGPRRLQLFPKGLERNLQQPNWVARHGSA